MADRKRPRKSRGAPPKNAARAHYDQLMKQGMGISEACRIVGISRSSGTRWRYGHTVVLKSGDIKKYAPISHHRPAVISARFLSESERITIADLLNARRSIRALALELGRSPSTVSREIRRNIHEPSGNYRPRTAQRSAERRRSRQRTGRIARNSELRESVREHLKQRWSPRQISNRLRTDFPGQPFNLRGATRFFRFPLWFIKYPFGEGSTQSRSPELSAFTNMQACSRGFLGISKPAHTMVP